MNPHLVIPGMRFEVTTVMVIYLFLCAALILIFSLQPIVNGAMIKWLKFDGFVHSDHFPNPNKSLESQFKKDKSISATVLYSLPLVRTVYLSMQNPAPFSIDNIDPNLESAGVPSGCEVGLGEIIDNAEIISASYKGVYLQLKSGKARGFVHTNQMPKLADGEDPRLKYPPKNRVQCRVLKYDHMDKVFLCTMLK